MTRSNTITSLIALSIVVCVGLACNRLMPAENTSTASNSTTTNSTTTGSNSAPDTTTGKKIDNPGLEKPDFTVTSEELDKEFTRKGVKEEELEKYKNKNIAVTGRVSMLVTEKKGTVQPWVTLYAPGILNGVSCYFDDDNVDQMKLLKEDKVATVQGFMDDFIVPEISPRLKHCHVVEVK